MQYFLFLMLLVIVLFIAGFENKKLMFRTGSEPFKNPLFEYRRTALLIYTIFIDLLVYLR